MSILYHLHRRLVLRRIAAPTTLPFYSRARARALYAAVFHDSPLQFISFSTTVLTLVALTANCRRVPLTALDFERIAFLAVSANLNFKFSLRDDLRDAAELPGNSVTRASRQNEILISASKKISSSFSRRFCRDESFELISPALLHFS